METDLEALRPDLLSTCQNAFQTEAKLDDLKLPTLTEAVKAHPGEKVEWSESFQIGAEKIEIASPVVLSQTATGHAGCDRSIHRKSWKSAQDRKHDFPLLAHRCLFCHTVECAPFASTLLPRADCKRRKPPEGGA
ncbi:hypothetical protein [Celeribacter baekdonensis]|uniref:hypothetical protein n=1 Tax=Celeribacter baekdonensis TaxID=875171 RepID=UPI00131F09C1|nr:hypothetical protein [Celeribacter baekdonensis]